MPEVRLNRLLKYLNVLIGLLFVAILACSYWYVARPLPKTSGTISVPVLQPATATRDSLGVSHVKAGGLEDALFVQGYVTAQDRLWQMDILRRVASGALSEVVGRAGLEPDLEARRLRVRRLAEGYADGLSAEDRAHFAAYARGVNHFLATHRDRLPLEFTVLRYDPRPWSIADSICIGLHMVRDLTSSWRDEVAKASMLATGDKNLVDRLFPVRTGQEAAPGSNAWVVSGKRSATGKPILANDPHLMRNFPSTWYMIHLEAPGLNVEGVSLPGLPGVIIGHNERIAWGITNLGFDVQDLYLEQMDVNSGRYVFRGALEQARPERELILVKGERAVEFNNWVTRHGPIWRTEGGRAFALKWVAPESGKFEFPFLQLNMARNWEEFRGALRRLWAPASNLVYADVNGNIGYQAAGLLPIRRTYNGDVPTNGFTGESEWEGFIPFDDLPTAYNPTGGVIVSANQNPFPADYKYSVSGVFAPHYREQQIRSLLSKSTALKPDDMLTIQKDVYSPFEHFLARQMAAVFDRSQTRNESLRPAVDILRKWNGQMDKDQPAPFLATLLYQQLRREIGDRASTGKGELWDTVMAAPAIERILRDRPPEWSRDYDQLLLRSLTDATEEGKRIQGRDPNRWRYGDYMEISVKHPVLGQSKWVNYIPTLGKYFRINIGTVRLSGSSFSVKQTTRRVGPSMRFVADTSNWDQSVMNISLGQSGQVLSSHYSDQWEHHYNGRGFLRPFTKVEGSSLELKPE